MKKLLIYLSLALILVVGVDIPGASAALLKSGTIFLSGDVNSIDGLITRTPDPKDPTKIFPADPGNQRFFLNILQGGEKAVILDDVSWTYDDFGGTIRDFYKKNGITTTFIENRTFNSIDLEGASLFIAPLPDDRFTEAEISALQGLLKRGGSVFFLGDCQDPKLFSDYNSRINDALEDLGSGMSIVINPGSFFDDSKDYVYPVAKDLQIATNLFTTGVTSFTYASPSQVKGGTPIFFGSGGQPFVAYEVVPVPASAWLLGSGLLGLGFFKRKSRKSPAA